MQFAATTTRGTETVLADELREIGATHPRPGHGVVTFSGPMDLGYRAAMWSRCASRILLQLDSFPCRDAKALYGGVRSVPWDKHISPHKTLAVHAIGTSQTLRDSRFTAQKVKDAIVDRLRQRRGARPDIDTRNPDLRVQLHLAGGRATVAIDLTGPLHKRSGRNAGDAPLRETLAAAIVRLSNWDGETPLVDPMCGSGTILREAVEMRMNIPAGLGRERWGFEGWLGHNREMWNEIVDEAKNEPRVECPPVMGMDADPEQVERARSNLRGLPVQVSVGEVADAKPSNAEAGCLITNPPYGERLDTEDLSELYKTLGNVLRRQFLGWDAWILTTPQLVKRIGLRPSRRIELRNGPIEVRLAHIPISPVPLARFQ